MPSADVGLGTLAFSPDGEEWFEFGPPGHRRRLAFHDYAAIYAVPGLYEYLFQDTLGMRTTAEVVRLFGEALSDEGLDPANQRVVDFGAGNGLGGALLREQGIGFLAGVDLEPVARDAAERDHPGVYDEYLTGDVGQWSGAELERLAETRPTSVLALSAVGLGHVPPEVLDRILGLLEPGGMYGFAVDPILLPGTDHPAAQESGYPDYLRRLMDETEVLARESYVHRRRADGSDDPAVAFIGRVG